MKAEHVTTTQKLDFAPVSRIPMTVTAKSREEAEFYLRLAVEKALKAGTGAYRTYYDEDNQSLVVEPANLERGCE
jgi:hypothetical protein